MKRSLKLFIIVVVTFIIMYCLYIYLSFGFLLEDEKYFLKFITIIIALISLVIYFRKRAFFKYMISVFIGVSMFFILSNSVRNYKIKVTDNNAKRVIEMLSNYRNNHDNYPSNLYELGDVPKNQLGIFSKDFEYKKEDDTYILKIYSYKEVKSYNSINEKWFIND